MIWSRYNSLFQENFKFFLYNSLSNSFAELDEETYNLLSKVEIGAKLDIHDAELQKQLVAMKAIVKSDDDTFLRLKYISSVRRHSNQQLALTINPTLDCNFACPYCFEKHHPHVYMTDEVELGIVDFVQKHEEVKTLNVTWFGGEPLLAFRRIESLTAKFLKMGIKYEAGIITNGYLLTDHVINRLQALLIKSIQVTIDGLAPVHDKRRCLKNGKPTFSTIINNIKKTHAACPDIKINVRVNVDKTNENDFVELFRLFETKEFAGIVLTPAFVDDIKNTNKCVLNSKEQNDYIQRLFKEHGIVFKRFYPRITNECFIRNRNFVVIGPSGELYKCWNDVGNESKVYGYVDGRITNEQILLRYLAASDPFEDKECKSCFLLPVCNGSCPYQRIQRDYEDDTINVCPLMKDNLKEYLLFHHKMKECQNK